MTITKAIRTTTVLLGAGAMLLLAGCSNNTPSTGDGAPVAVEKQEALFEFQTSVYGANDGELTVRLPGELLDMMGSDGLGPIVEGFHLKAKTLEGSSKCAVDIEVAYVGDALSAFADEEKTRAAKDTENYGEDTPRDYTGSMSVFSSGSGVEPIEELDPEDTGIYRSEDHTEATAVLPCASEPMSDDSFSLAFYGTKDGRTDSFARFDVTVMKSGTLTVTEAEVDDYVLDSQGNWIAD